MRVQVRVEGAGGVMGEFCGDEIACTPLASCATNADTSCRESLEVLQRCLHGPRMSFKNPLVIILLLASAISAFTGEVANFVIISLIVILGSTYLQERLIQ